MREVCASSGHGRAGAGHLHAASSMPPRRRPQGSPLVTLNLRAGADEEGEEGWVSGRVHGHARAGAGGLRRAGPAPPARLHPLRGPRPAADPASPRRMDRRDTAAALSRSPQLGTLLAGRPRPCSPLDGARGLGGSHGELAERLERDCRRGGRGDEADERVMAFDRPAPTPSTACRDGRHPPPQPRNFSSSKAWAAARRTHRTGWRASLLDPRG